MKNKKVHIRYAYRYYELVVKKIRRIRKAKNDSRLNNEFRDLRMLLINAAEANRQLRMRYGYYNQSIPENRYVGFKFPKRTKVARKKVGEQNRVWTFTIDINDLNVRQSKIKKYHWTHGPLEKYNILPETHVILEDIAEFLDILEHEIIFNVMKERSMIMLSVNHVSKFCFSKMYDEPQENYYEFQALDGDKVVSVYLVAEDIVRVVKYEKIIRQYHIPYSAIALNDPLAGFDDIIENIQDYLSACLIVTDDINVAAYLFANDYVPEGTLVISCAAADEDRVFCKNVYGTLPAKLVHCCHTYIPCDASIIESNKDLKPIVMHK